MLQLKSLPFDHDSIYTFGHSIGHDESAGPNMLSKTCHRRHKHVVIAIVVPKGHLLLRYCTRPLDISTILSCCPVGAAVTYVVHHQAVVSHVTRV